ncbi:MAG: DUF362 domain-containing protein [Anaerolineales bacterium]|nr:DUF362 domain-containing protein [Anaerolineales bacterium]
MTVLVTNGRDPLKSSIHKILDTFLTEEDYSRGIFLKPNIVFPVTHGSHEITSPLFVKNLIEGIREIAPDTDIVIGEGVAAGLDPWENFKVSGYVELARDLDVPLIDLHEAKRTTVDWKFGRLELPQIAFERTYINLPILKPSSACVMSGALKNQKGLLLPGDKKKFHRLGLHEQIAELNKVMRPALTIMDCSRYFARDVLISGDNCGEIDAAICQLLKIEEPEHVVLSRNAQVFSTGYDIVGDKVDRESSPPELKEYKSVGRLRLWSNPQACTMCRAIFRDLKQHPFKPQNIIVGMKLMVYAVKGAEIIMGSNPKWQKEYDTVICVGACTHRVAKEGDYVYIPGCPPTLQDLNKYLPW